MSQQLEKKGGIEAAFKTALMSKGASSEAAPRKADPSKPGVSMPIQPEDIVSKTLALEAEVRTMRKEFRQFQHETSIELSRLDEFEDRMDFLEVEDEDENANASELTLSELMTGVEYERPILQGKVRKPKSEMGGKGKESDVSSKMQADQELIDLLQQQVTSLTTALEEVSARCATLERDVAMRRTASPSIPPVPPLTDSQEAAAAAAATATASAATARAAAASAAASAAAVAQTRNTKNKNKGPPTSVPSAPGPSAPAPAAATPAALASPSAHGAAPSYAQVAGKAKKLGLTREAIEKAADPAKLLLVQPRDAGARTQDVAALVLKAPLTLEAQAKAYLAWKGLLKAKVGSLPLSIVLISPRRCLTYWDVTAEESLPELVKTLWRSGFLEHPVPADTADKALRLRAYLASYFPILRRAALDGLSADDRSWLLEKAETRWKTSADKVAQRMWIKRIKRDRGDGAEDIPLGESWSFTSAESVGTLIASCKAETGNILRAPTRRHGLRKALGSEFDDDVDMAEPRASTKRASSRPASVAEEDEDGAEDVPMDD